jgi:xanthine dehydrogenase accessory factor
MTREIRDILKAFKAAKQQGRQTALATVIQVEGSSYRRPGARMLMEDNGRMTGAISGGCLEGDAYRQAMLVMVQKQNKLVTYNSMDNEADSSFGVQLGCNGIVHILFEPIDPNQHNNPIDLLEAACAQRKEGVLVTLFSLQNFYGPQPGTCFFTDGATTKNNIADNHLKRIVAEDAMEVVTQKLSVLKQYSVHPLTGFFELIQPPVSLIIAGAGNDALPLVDMATVLGWQVTIVDGRATHANTQRFSKAHSIIVEKPEEAIKQIAIDERTAFVLMTHNYHYDLAMMRLLLPKKCRYIGTLGPKKRLERMLTVLQEQGITITGEQQSGIYGPTGLDIGAEAPEEIALSILAEIKAVLADHQADFLRNRPEAIHSRPVNTMDETSTRIRNII